MSELISHTVRRAAHSKHVCRFCGRRIAAREEYNDDRLTEGGSAYTFRSHLDCFDAWCSWGPDEDDIDLLDITEGHLPPCPLAWAPPGYRSAWWPRDAPPDTRGACTCATHTGVST